MIYSYNKSQRDALFRKFILTKVLYMFRTDLSSIIRSLKTVYTAVGTCHASSVDCLLAVNRTSMYVCVSECMCLCICLCMCAYVCVCVLVESDLIC
jgi:hypothetical protein